MGEAKQEATAMRALYAQIEDICKHFKEIRSEAAGIVATSQMPDATLHLNDVLQATEEATTTILDAATSIGSIISENALAEELSQRINNELGRIYEASSFQDISGQRIKKVLRHLSELEAQLIHLSEAARGQQTAPKTDTLLNGPALASAAPSQSDVDDMFKSA